jgi:hypothetical protein
VPRTTISAIPRLGTNTLCQSTLTEFPPLSRA